MSLITKPNKLELSSFSPIAMLELNFCDSFKNLTETLQNAKINYKKALAIIRCNEQIIGTYDIDLNIDNTEILNSIWQTFQKKINLFLDQQGLRRYTEFPIEKIKLESNFQSANVLISVLIATRNRTEWLQSCLMSLLEQTHEYFEVVIVNSAGNKDELEACLKPFHDKLRISSYYEEVAGVARAQNTAARNAKGHIFSFIDDDVIVDKYFLSHLANSFQEGSHVGCVNGLIVPIELETKAQQLIEQFGGFSRGFDIRKYNNTNHHPWDSLFPYTAGRFGSGANMAFSKAAFEHIGGFDESLGTGSKAMGGHDVASYFDIIEHGYTLIYQPNALVWHRHRRDYPSLKRQSFHYGAGLTAYLSKTIVDKPSRALTLIFKFIPGLRHLFSKSSPKNKRKGNDYPAELTWLERLGMLLGPMAFLRSKLDLWWRKRRKIGI